MPSPFSQEALQRLVCGQADAKDIQEIADALRAYNRILAHHQLVEDELLELRELAGKLNQQIKAYEADDYAKSWADKREEQIKLRQ